MEIFISHLAQSKDAFPSGGALGLCIPDPSCSRNCNLAVALAIYVAKSNYDSPLFSFKPCLFTPPPMHASIIDFLLASFFSPFLLPSIRLSLPFISSFLFFFLLLPLSFLLFFLLIVSISCAGHDHTCHPLALTLQMLERPEQGLEMLSFQLSRSHNNKQKPQPAALSGGMLRRFCGQNI